MTNSNDVAATPRVIPNAGSQNLSGDESVEPNTRILIVVDDRRAGRALARQLIAIGYREVHAVSDAKRAIAASNSFLPAIIFLDVAMSEIDSYELARKLRRDARQRGVRLIALTDQIEHSTRDEARVAGFERWLVTPVADTELDKVLRRKPVSLAAS
jgi:PleD family two-component response regulator